MYSLTNENNDFYIHIECGCGLKFRVEEMYICYKFCLNEEIESCFCKNYCKRHQSISVTQAKKMKNSCDQCLECPNCQTGLVKRFINGKYLYSCPYCYWDTTSIKFCTSKESDLDSLIFQLKESSTKGYLKKMYDHVINRLKDNEGLITESAGLMRSSFMRTSIMGDLSMQINKAMEFRTWDVENLAEKLENEEKEFKNKQIMKYDDNYINDYKTYFAFPAVANFLANSLDFSEKNSLKFDSYETIRDKLKNELDVGLVTSLEQRLNHVTSQHISINVFFPKFVDLVPNKSKRCKFCKKYIVQVEENIKKQGQKLELCHVFLNQFPYCYISQIESNQIFLKFCVFDFKDSKISFDKDETSLIEVNVPNGTYELSENTKEIPDDEFIVRKSDRCLILKFGYKAQPQQPFYFIKFIVKAEYKRLDLTKTILYPLEVKFKI